MPFGIGTLGAVIRIRSPIPTRAAEIDIGVAGPLAGLAVAVPLYAWGPKAGDFVGTFYENERVGANLLNYFAP